VRHEMKDGPVYVMVLGKGGPKFKPSPDSPDLDPSGGPPPIASAPLILAPGAARLGICCGRAELHHVTMAQFADLLASQTDSPVIDKTGISGTFEISLHWAADYSAVAQSDTSPEPSIYTAVQEQLGIKLEQVSAPLNYLFVEHVHKPSQY